MDKISENRKHCLSGVFLSKLLARTQIVIGIHRIRPVHIHLGVIAVPVDVRNISIGIARAAYCLVSSVTPIIFYKII